MFQIVVLKIVSVPLIDIVTRDIMYLKHLLGRIIQCNSLLLGPEI